MIKWKDEYSVGVKKLDEQHKKLFEIGNKAYEVLNNDFYLDKFDKIVEIIHELEDYTIFHFAEEEEYMKEIKHKQLLSHIVEHKDFIEKIQSIDLDAVDSDQEKHLREILNFVMDWVINHILDKDKLYSLSNE